MDQQLKNTAKELKKNIDIIKPMFDLCNVEILNLTVKPYSTSFSVYIELTKKTEGECPDFKIKLNFYNENGDLITMEKTSVFDFDGYDTIEMYFGDENILLEAVKGRLYITDIDWNNE